MTQTDLLRSAAVQPAPSGGYRFPFKNPHVALSELKHVAEALKNGHRSSGGRFTRLCEDWLLHNIGGRSVLLTQSCTAALEVAQALAEVGPGDEVIMPSFSFSSVANAVAVRGGVPVFVDIRADTLNLDETLVESAVTRKTKAIVCVHYAGVVAEMDALHEIARHHDLLLIEDAAHAFQSTYKGRPAGSIGHLGVFSFHDTKDINCGEGGAIVVNDPALVVRARIIVEKGTNRQEFLQGRASRYTWVDIGHSAQPSEITASVLWAQLQFASGICGARVDAWHAYHDALERAEHEGLLRRPVVPTHCGINGNCYYIVLPARIRRGTVIDALKQRGIETAFHFVPLHSSPAGERCGRSHGPFVNTDVAGDHLLRLPLWPGIAPHCAHIARELERVLKAQA